MGYLTPLSPPLLRGEIRESSPLSLGEIRKSSPLSLGEIRKSSPLHLEEIRESSPLPLARGGLGWGNLYLTTGEKVIYEVVISRHQLIQMVTSKKDEHYF